MMSPEREQVPVLVVDDDAQMLRTLHDLLKIRGYEPLTAGSATLGLRIAERLAHSLAVALVDLRLPDMDGIELIGRLHALSELTEVVILTGHASLDTAVQALRSESFDYLVKPVKPDHLLKTMQSATERWHRRVMEQRLMETEERFRLLVENISDVILVIGRDGTIQYASPSIRRVLDLTADALTGTVLLDHVHPDDRTSVEHLLAASESVPSAPWEHRLRHRDGSWRTVESTVNDLRDHPRVGGVVMASRDIGDRKRLEAQLLLSRKMESVGRLAGGVAHDFNNLLTVILGATTVAVGDLEEDSPLREPLADVLQAAERAADLTRQLLAFSRQQILQPRVLDLNELVTDMEKLLRRVIPEHIGLRTSLASGLWPVRADPAQIGQVLMNLAVNARDAMPDGGRLTIRTSMVRGEGEGRGGILAGDHVVLEVEDTGEGISPELQDRIFEPFFTTKEMGKGTGLGLATVHGIVEQSGGRLGVTSELGRGTTFRVALPRVEPATTRPRADVPALPGGTETVLVVEDQDLLRGLVAGSLTRHGYRVVDVATGEAALQVAAGSGKIHLLFTDVGLPGMNGVSLARRVREIHPGVKVLFTTGYTDQELGSGRALGEEVALLQKPFTPEEVLREVRRVLDSGPPLPPR